MLELLRRVEYIRRIYRRRMMGNFKDLSGSFFALAFFTFLLTVSGMIFFPPIALLGPIVDESLVTAAIVVFTASIFLWPIALALL